MQRTMPCSHQSHASGPLTHTAGESSKQPQHAHHSLYLRFALQGPLGSQPVPDMVSCCNCYNAAAKVHVAAAACLLLLCTHLTGITA